MAQGFRQKEGVDYQEVFAPTIGHESIRCILSLAASFDMEIHHMDIKTAFLHGELEETVYMKQPPGFARAGLQDYVCRLKRSIYGLKQSPRQWNRVIDGYLKEHGFRPSICEPCVYIRMIDDQSIIILPHCRSNYEFTSTDDSSSECSHTSFSVNWWWTVPQSPQ